jgi:hypothetical protein
MADRHFLQRLADSELPRRVLGAMLSVFAPGAGHVVIGHQKIGAIIAAIMLALFGLATLGAVLVVPTLFLLAFGVGIFLLIVCVVSVFAVPPGPSVREGLRALWPALVIVAVFRAATFFVGNYVVGVVPVPDDALAPELRKGDWLLVHPGPTADPGDVVLVQPPTGTSHLVRDDGATADIHGRALFVLASGAGDGRGRIWKSLHK